MGRYAKSHMAVRCFLPAQPSPKCRGDTTLMVVFSRNEAVWNNNLICEKSPTNSFDRQKKILFIRQGTQCNGQCVLYNMLLYGSSHNCGKKQDRIISFFSVIKGQFWPFYVSDFWWTSTCRLFQVKRAAAGLGTCPGQGGGRGKAPRETSSQGLQSRPATMSQMQLQMEEASVRGKQGQDLISKSSGKRFLRVFLWGVIVATDGRIARRSKRRVVPQNAAWRLEEAPASQI